MSDRAVKLAGLFAWVAYCSLLVFTWELNARGQRAFAAAVSRNRAERARLQVLLDREHREAVEIKALLERLMERLDGAEAAGPGREQQGPRGGSFD
jgi:hypothetical protein